MKKLFFSLAIFFAILLSPILCFAAGGFFGTKDKPLIPSDQKALIYFKGDHEDMIVFPKYSGKSTDFLFITALPHPAKVSIAPIALFDNLVNITATNEITAYQKDNSALDVFETSLFDQNVVGPSSIEEKTFKNTEEFVQFLSDQDLKSDYDLEDLDRYILNNWYFYVAKMATDTDQEIDRPLMPLRFSFESKDIIYPLLLTQITSKQRAAFDTSPLLTIYEIGESRVTNNLLNLRWARKLEASSIDAIKHGLADQTWLDLSSEMFLTKHAGLLPENDQNYLLFTPDSSTRSFPLPFYQDDVYWQKFIQYFAMFLLIAFISPFWLVFAIFLIYQRYDPERFKKISLISEISLLILTFGIWILPFLSDPDQNLVSKFSDPSLAGYALAVFALIATQTILTARKLFSYNKLTPVSKPTTTARPVRHFLGLPIHEA